MTRSLGTGLLLLATACGSAPAFASEPPPAPDPVASLECAVVGLDLVQGLVIMHCTLSVEEWNALPDAPEPEDEGTPV